MKNINISGLYNFDNSNPNFVYEDGSNVKIDEEIESLDKLSNELVVYLPDKKLFFKSRTIKINNLTFVAPFPNPIHLLIFTSIENYNDSVSTLNKFENCENQKSKNVILLELNNSNTSTVFNDFVRYRIISIVTIINAMEVFLNQIIPGEFEYHTIEKGIKKVYNKKSVESSKISFKEKLTSVIDQFKKGTDFVLKNSDLIETILETYRIRKDIVHLKTNSETKLGLYWETIGKILEFDIALAIENTIKYINNVEKDFISK